MPAAVSAYLSRAANWLVARRSRLPKFANRAIDHVIANQDGALRRLINPLFRSFDDADVPPVPPLPPQERRLYIGPTNYAGQGYLWARAVEHRLPAVGAVNMAFGTDHGFSFAADYEVPMAVYMASRRWQEAQLAYVEQFTHVLLEAQRPLFGRLFGGDAFVEARHLAEQGLDVAMMCHGTDVRLPSRHLATHRWSPFTDRSMGTDTLEQVAAANRAGLDALGAPVFVSTPDLLADVPYAAWCPVVVEPERWHTGREPLERRKPLVVHVPSRSVVKGTELIAPVLERMSRDGLIDFRYVEGVPARDMPALYGEADIVLDQFRIGSYGVAACEAMAAGRVVIGHVDEDVRRHVRSATGSELPVVEATPVTLSDVIETVLSDAARYRAIARDGIDFVHDVHDGTRSARVLAPFLTTGAER